MLNAFITYAGQNSYILIDINSPYIYIRIYLSITDLKLIVIIIVLMAYMYEDYFFDYL